MRVKSKKILMGSAFAAVVTAGSVGSLMAQEKPVIATVVKISGIPWFDRMETGVESLRRAKSRCGCKPEWTCDLGFGTAAADQSRTLSPRASKHLAVVPMDPAVLEGTLKRAMERGTIVVTHEADNQVNTNVDVEAFNNDDLRHCAERAARRVHGQEG